MRRYCMESAVVEGIREKIAKAIDMQFPPGFEAIVSDADFGKCGKPTMDNVWIDDSYLYVHPRYYEKLRKGMAENLRDGIALAAGCMLYYYSARNTSHEKSSAEKEIHANAEREARKAVSVHPLEERHLEAVIADIFGLISAAKAGYKSREMVEIFGDCKGNDMYPPSEARKKILLEVGERLRIF